MVPTMLGSLLWWSFVNKTLSICPASLCENITYLVSNLWIFRLCNTNRFIRPDNGSRLASFTAVFVDFWAWLHSLSLLPGRGHIGWRHVRMPQPPLLPPLSLQCKDREFTGVLMPFLTLSNILVHTDLQFVISESHFVKLGKGFFSEVNLGIFAEATSKNSQPVMKIYISTLYFHWFCLLTLPRILVCSDSTACCQWKMKAAMFCLNCQNTAPGFASTVNGF